MPIFQEEAVMLTLIGALNKASFWQELEERMNLHFLPNFYTFYSSNIASTRHQYTEKLSFPLCIQLLFATDMHILCFFLEDGR